MSDLASVRPGSPGALKLSAARLRAAESQPFLAVALYALIVVEHHGTETFGVDGRWHLFADPEAVERWSVEEIAGVLLHEVGHVVRDHAGRARALGVEPNDRQAWNVAADIEINDGLVADGVRLPPDGCTSERFMMPPHRAAEFYYERLRGVRLPECDCGEGAHGIGPRIGSGLIVDAPGVSALEADLIRRGVATDIVAASRVKPGSVPGSWTRWAEALLVPQLDWRRMLRSAIGRGLAISSGSVDFTYARLSRRQVDGVVLASLARPVPAVAVVVDVSGSVATAALHLAFTEVHACIKQMGVRRDLVSVWATDTQADQLAIGTAPRIQMRGGGGTDMGVGIAAALRQRSRPGLIVVLTDGHTPWPVRPPACRVVVALLPSPFEPDPPPRWAHTVRVEDPLS